VDSSTFAESSTSLDALCHGDTTWSGDMSPSTGTNPRELEDLRDAQVQDSELWSHEKICPFFPSFDFSVDTDFNVFHASDEDVGTLAITVRSDLPSTSWPSGTNLVYAEGNKVKLMLQHPLVKLVIQEAFDNFKAAILFTHAFPDAKLSLTFAKDALILGAKRHLPATQDILTQVSHDDEYISKINILVHAFDIYGMN
jgi:hypothetical protein